MNEWSDIQRYLEDRKLRPATIAFLKENYETSALSAEQIYKLWLSKGLESAPKSTEKNETEKGPFRGARVTDMWKNEMETLLVGILRNLPDMKITVHSADMQTYGNETLQSWVDHETGAITIKLELKQ